MPKRIVLLVALATGCAKASPVTAPGTVLVAWDASKASRTDFAKATIGPRLAKDYGFTVSTKDTPPFTLAVHVEIADVDYTEDGRAVHQRAPVAIAVTVKTNTGWELSGQCRDGPNYKMPSVGPDGGLVTPLGMSQECQIKQHRSAGIVFTGSWDIGFSIIPSGDGTISAFPDTGVTIE